jgi:hypothetical protein
MKRLVFISICVLTAWALNAQSDKTKEIGAFKAMFDSANYQVHIALKAIQDADDSPTAGAAIVLYAEILKWVQEKTTELAKTYQDNDAKSTPKLKALEDDFSKVTGDFNDALKASAKKFATEDAFKYSIDQFKAILK